MVDKNIIGALKMRNIFLRYPNINYFYNIVIRKIEFYSLLNVKSSLLISSIVIALLTITIAIGCHSFSLFKTIALLFANAFKSNNYCYRYTWKSYNFMSCNKEKKPGTNLQNRYKELSKIIKSFCYRKVRRVITKWGTIDKTK